MKSIGFKNFRRFEKLDPLQLGDITFFVGGNNAGKSTVVKAMMLVFDNLSARTLISDSGMTFDAPTFRLDANRIHEVHIGTFGRALHKPYPEQKELVLEADVDNYHFQYVLNGDTESTQANAGIKSLEIINTHSKVRYFFDFQKSEVIVNYNTSVLWDFARSYSSFREIRDAKEVKQQIENLQNQRSEIVHTLKNFEGDAVTLARLNSNFRAIEKKIEALKKSADPFGGRVKIEDVKYKDTFVLSEKIEKRNLINWLLSRIANKFKERFYFSLDDTITPAELDGRRRKKLTQEDIAFGRMVDNDLDHISVIRAAYSIEYIAAHSASQKVLFSIEDKNDYMASVIREFKQCRIEEGSREDLFITRWMNELEIGLRYKIESISGEAYTVDITNKQGYEMPLADMGMGSIQMMLLLFKLATIIRVCREIDSLIIVEEPEQNIHPKLQSKLAELFAEVNQEYGFRFVIETHSEYMIRKSQVQVAAMQFANQEELEQKCPIKTYYFPGDSEPDQKPYNMRYRTDGNFENDFGSGFYDVASDLAFQTF